MNGFNFSQRTTTEEEAALYGRIIRKQMRKHGVTIRALAKRVDTSMKKVREVREACDYLNFLGWFENITGVNTGKAMRLFMDNGIKACIGNFEND